MVERLVLLLVVAVTLLVAAGYVAKATHTMKHWHPMFVEPALGYFGLSYYLENKSRLKVLQVNSGNGCVTPSVASVQSRAYKPLSRGLFVYAKKKAFKRDVVAAFIRHMIVNERAISRTAKIVPLTQPQLRKAQRQYNTAIRNRKNY